MQLSIVIVNWNSQRYLERCIPAVEASARGLDYEIVVIDSGSFDGCGEMLARKHPLVRFVQSPDNLGFAKANNRAFQECRGEFVLFLNPDTEPLGAAVADMYLTIQTLPGAGAVGPRLLNSDRSVQLCCVRSLPTVSNRIFDTELLHRFWVTSGVGRTALWRQVLSKSDGPAIPRAFDVEALSGACLMVRRSAFQRVGRFSEDYFIYAEDMDLSFKLRQAGYRNYLLPALSVVHHGGGSSAGATNGFSAVMLREATWRFFRKTRGPAYGGVYRVAMGIAAIVRLTLIACALALWGNRQMRDACHRAWRKWSAILRWCVHRSDLVQRYYPSNECPVAQTAR